MTEDDGVQNGPRDAKLSADLLVDGSSFLGGCMSLFSILFPTGLEGLERAASGLVQRDLEPSMEVVLGAVERGELKTDHGKDGFIVAELRRTRVSARGRSNK